jgi:hypothetical protein
VTYDVVPDWQDHASGPTCWCMPTYEKDLVSGHILWTHRAASDDPHRYTPDNDPALRAPARTWAVKRSD